MGLMVLIVMLFILFMTAVVVYSIANNPGVRQLQNSRLELRNRPSLFEPPAQVVQKKESAEQIRQRVTKKALERAAVEPGTLPYELTDIGLLTHQNGTLHIVRDNSLPVDAPYIRPFIEITTDNEMQLPVILQILDHQRKVIYRDGDIYTVSGKTILLPKTQLSLKDREINPVHGWSLWVLVDEVPFAIHPFEWEVELEENLILKEVISDGEITDRLRQMVEESEMSEVSLTELLSDEQNTTASRKNLNSD